ncbi:glycosyltransferase [Vibrio navarrensis]
MFGMLNNQSYYDYIFITNVPAFYKSNLYNELAKKLKIKVIYISEKSIIRNNDFVSGIRNFEYEVITTKPYENRNKLSVFYKIIKVLLTHRYDRVVFPGWESKELIPLFFLSDRKKNSVIIESSIYDTKSSGLSWIIKKILISRVSLAFPSGILQLEILKKADYKGKYSITNGVGLLPRSNIKYRTQKGDSIKYLYVGRLSHEKNVEFIIERFNSLERSLTIIGEGPQKEYLQKIANRNVIFLGYVNNQELLDLYSEYDVFVLPSRSEPWGLVIDEALSSGLPVIVSNKVGCSEDLVINPRLGLVFECDKPSSFIKAIYKLEDDYSSYKERVLKFNFKHHDEKQITAYLSQGEFL